MKKVIAIDFDGTLFENKWPEIGMPIAPNINRAKNEKANGAVLILWTCREGEKLCERERGRAESGVWNGPA